MLARERETKGGLSLVGFVIDPLLWLAAHKKNGQGLHSSDEVNTAIQRWSELIREFPFWVAKLEPTVPPELLDSTESGTTPIFFNDPNLGTVFRIAESTQRLVLELTLERSRSTQKTKCKRRSSGSRRRRGCVSRRSRCESR